jgi:hypothetical protein
MKETVGPGRRVLAGCVLAAFAFGGCATVARSKSDDTLFIDSYPPGATIFVNRELAGQTPRLVPMPRDHEIEVRCRLAGYRDAVTTVRREAAPATQFDSPAFAVVDALTGADQRLQKHTLFVELTPLLTATQ